MRLSKKDKQTLQEKIKAQRQAMWSGKQSTAQNAEEKTAEADQLVQASGDVVDNTTGSTDTTPPDSQSDPSPTTTTAEKTSQGEPSVQSESGSEGEASASLFEVTPSGESSEDQARSGERVFWDADQEGGAKVLTWKLVLGVIGVAIVLIGVGVWLGFLFAS